MAAYFVYGALMRHPRVRELGSKARLDGFEARFVASGIPIVEPTFLGLVPVPEGCAHGVCVDISDEEWADIAAHESGYDLVSVALADGRQALALVICEEQRCAEGWPSRRYAKLLVEGAAHFELPVLPKYEEAVRRGNPITAWVAVPIAFLRDHAPWLGPYGVVGLALALPFLLLALAMLAIATVLR